MSYPTPFKRQRPGGGYFTKLYIRFQVRGKKHLFCLKTADPALAKVRARQYYDAVVGGAFHLAGSMQSGSKIPSFAKLFEAYKTLPLAVTKVTRDRNISSFRIILAAAGLNEESRVDQLGESVAIRFQQEQLAGGKSINTVNSRLRTARSLFSRRALTAFRGVGIDIGESWIKGFMGVGCLPVRGGNVDIPGDDLIAKAHETLAVTPDLYRCFLLAAYGGLRAGEIRAARWSWFKEGVLYIGAEADFTTKSGKWRAVRLAPEILARLEHGDKTALFIAGASPNETVRRVWPKALREIGFTGRNPGHSLRRWAGSKVAEAAGIYAAQNMLGHSTPAVTAKHYLRQINLPGAIPMAGQAS